VLAAHKERGRIFLPYSNLRPLTKQDLSPALRPQRKQPASTDARLQGDQLFSRPSLSKTLADHKHRNTTAAVLVMATFRFPRGRETIKSVDY